MRRRLSFLFTAASLCAALGAAQTTGGIAGWISDSLGAPLSGVTVGAVGANLQGTRVGVTAKDGTYRLPALPPGRYVVRASLPGFASVEKAVAVGVDSTSTVKMILEVALRESVFVSAETPFVDTTSTTAVSDYASNVIIHLPLDRNYADVALGHPGTVTDHGSSQGRSISLAINGSTSAESQWSIDGINTTNVMLGVQGKAYNNEAVQEVEVKTGGFQAEYGRSVGGVINVVTKSGGNALHGDAFFYYDDSSLQANRVFVDGVDSTLSGMKLADYQRYDYGADLGGSLLKDRLWFFGAYDRTSFPAEVSRFVSSYLVPSTMRFPLDGTDELYSLKLTWNIASGSTLVGTVFSDPTTNSGAGAADPRRSSVVFRDITSPDPGTWQADRSIGAIDYALRFGQVFGSSGFFNFLAARHQDRFRLDATQAGAAVQTKDFTCPGGSPRNPRQSLHEFIPPVPNFVEGGYGNLGGPGNNSESWRNQFRADLNVYRGPHEFKIGADYQNAETTALAKFSGDQHVNKFDNYGTVYYAHNFFYGSAGDLVPASGAYRGGIREVGAYIQDSWNAAPGLTINAGLRWDEEGLRDYRGVTVMQLSNEWQPRLGVAWDPWRDGSTNVYAFAGRFYYSLPTFVAARAFGGVVSRTTFNYDPIDVTPADPPPGHRVNQPPGDPSLSEVVDDNLRGISLDELTVGVQRLVGRSLTIGLKASYRKLSNVIEDRCDLDNTIAGQGFGCAIFNTGGSGQYARGNFYSCTGLDNPENNNCLLIDANGNHPLVYGAPASAPATRLYKGIELLARETVGDALWLQASYVYSSLRGNYDGEVNEGFFQTSPGINMDYDYPPLQQNSNGRLYLDRPVDFRVSGFYRTPLKLSVGIEGYVVSGAPLDKTGYFNTGFISAVRLVPRGSAGRLPTLWEANATLEYPMRLGPTTVTLQGFVYNLFNNQIRTSQDMQWTYATPHAVSQLRPKPTARQRQLRQGHGPAGPQVLSGRGASLVLTRGQRLIMRRRLSFLFTAASLCAALGAAQTTGGIAGWISDSLGAPLPGVTVGVVGANLQGTRVGVTAKDGTYRLPALPPGRYVVRASLPGFATVEKAVTVGVDATSTVKMILEVALRESVFVSAETPFVDTTSTTAASGYGSTVIIHLPLDRNYADVALGHPGTVTDHGDSQGRSISPRDQRIDLRRESVVDRRHQHDQRHGGSPGQGLQQRGRTGGRGQDRRLPGGVRPVGRGRDQRRHQVGRQRAAWRRLLLLRRLEPASEPGLRHWRGLDVERDEARRLPAVRLRRRPRRVPVEGPALVLRRLQPNVVSGRGFTFRLELPGSLDDEVSPGRDRRALLPEAHLERRERLDAGRDGLLGSHDELRSRRGRSAQVVGRLPRHHEPGSRDLAGGSQHRGDRLRPPLRAGLRLLWFLQLPGGPASGPLPPRRDGGGRRRADGRLHVPRCTPRNPRRSLHECDSTRTELRRRRVRETGWPREQQRVLAKSVSGGHEFLPRAARDQDRRRLSERRNDRTRAILRRPTRQPVR